MQGNEHLHTQHDDSDTPHENEVDGEEVFVDANDDDSFEAVHPNTKFHFEEMAHDYFARVDEIHQQFADEEDTILDFEDMSAEDEESDDGTFLEELLQQATKPSYHGSRTSRLQFNIILMSLCTLFSVSHHCLDEILTFLKHDVLPPDNNCPENSYKMKTLLMKLGLSHESIHCCNCGKTLYWKRIPS